MKKIILILVTLGFAVNSFAQVTATASASATIVNPISITKTEDMNFGNIETGSSAIAVVMTPSGSRSTANGAALPAAAGTVTAASFKIAGSGTFTFAITLPSTAHILTSGANSMTVDAFTSTPNAIGALSNGVQTISVGATLHVAELQAPGSYRSISPFEVTVNYN